MYSVRPAAAARVGPLLEWNVERLGIKYLVAIDSWSSANEVRRTEYAFVQLQLLLHSS